MSAWKLRVDWICHYAYGDAVEVYLDRMDDDVTLIHKEPTIPRAVGWAIKYMSDRGRGYWCDINYHQQSCHTYITLHAVPLSRTMGASSSDT